VADYTGSPQPTPVVLMHGFGAFMHLLANLSVNPMLDRLTADGRHVFAPMVQPYNRVPERANRWMSHLRAILDETGAHHMHLIGFSSGGLDARWVISRLEGYRFVKSLTTISTPHHGSGLADYIMDSPDPVRTTLTRVADWMGNRLEGAQVSESSLAIEHLTRSYVDEVFNPEVPDHPDVTYASWSGRAGEGTDVPITPLLRIPNRIVFEREGINDGIVSAESAKWTGYQGMLSADHARQIGINALNGDFDALGFVSSLIDQLDRTIA
jgi:triacylglycerol lipase